MSRKIEINYDDQCVFCQRSVNWLRKRDRRGRFSYAALPPGASCVTLRDEAGTSKASTAALRALRHLGGGWRITANVLLIIPRPIRDAVYQVIARNRRRKITEREATQSSAE
ncbi:MAG: DUF393 domain-containing protein [Rhodothermaceae bacterium]|nr:DUF393 domain-containing protein [Rhodothermaceae bacterium]MXX59617.1 DUF393 domain-containing protein [Rhodothermaceae bacterium]MYD19431.1 DUF393 domain-containing protein [Rhodothermaceae bacterium]MYD56329.1 DUF393 domain-containing protein [Rhodothermaceae bacterium]MYJ56192.1 DUF393 domain-containing protein [Rhodothermaceae bacterium]